MKIVLMDTFWMTLDNAVSDISIAISSKTAMYSLNYIASTGVNLNWLWILILIPIVALIIVIVGLSIKLAANHAQRHNQVDPI